MTKARDRSGDFDFYVLALSWSPSYCEAAGRNANRNQCESGRPYAFVVHGLWPQRERGWPKYCRADRARPARRTISSMLDIMPSPGLVAYQWKKHGSCSGLVSGDYFDLVRSAREKIAIPAAFNMIDGYKMVDPVSVEAAFLAANDGIRKDGIAVTCDRRRLREVRICMTKGLEFRACPEIDADGCRKRRVVMPPVRGR